MAGFGLTTKQGGACMTTGPLDVCKVPGPPPVPAPFPNAAQPTQADASTCTQKTKIAGQPGLKKDSQISMSSGDEAGSAGGVVNPTIKGPCLYKRFSTKLKLEGANAVYQLCNTTHNGTNPNAPLGMQTAPSQTKVTVTM
jgi:hypothetical protein